jgi:hypothetical protein
LILASNIVFLVCKRREGKKGESVIGAEERRMKEKDT